MTRPSGLRRSDPIFAQSLFVATPTDSTRPSCSRTSRFSALAMLSAPPNRCSVAVTSRNASSSEIGSTSGVRSAKSAMTASDAASYFWPSPGTKIPSGHSRPAVWSGIAEWMPNARASYEAAATTPRSFGPPPTITGFPRYSG